jgi:hypothetical protein
MNVQASGEVSDQRHGLKAKFDTNFVFEPGKVAVVMDGGAGSSGKGKVASFIGEHADNWQFCVNSFMSNAAHWVILDDGRKFLYQSLNSVAYQKQYQKLYIGGGSVIEIEPTLREIKENDVEPGRLGIHPLVAVVQQKDIDYECGRANFDGDPKNCDVSNMKIGSTLHGVGAARARRILRRSDVLLAKDVSALAPYICWTDKEILNRLREGQAGLLEVAQGFQLSYLSKYYPKTTSRNCTVMAGLDDCMIPPRYAGNVVINFRTYPIRVNSNKYVYKGEVLTSDAIAHLRGMGLEHEIEVIRGDSGGCYDDQFEITWDQVTERSGIKSVDPQAEIRELSSLTKLERRVYTFSKKNVIEAVDFNRTNGKTFLSVNFVNYVDAQMGGVRGGRAQVSNRLNDWILQNIPFCPDAELKFLGTGPRTDDMLLL